MTEQIKIRRDTSAHFATDNPILGQADPAMETDGQATASVRTKIGDGTTAWAAIPFLHQLADGSTAGAAPTPPLAPGVTTAVTLTNGVPVTSISLLGIVPAMAAQVIIMVTDGAGQVQEFTLSASTTGGTGVSGTPIVLSVSSATITLNTGNGYAVSIGGQSLSFGFGAPSATYGADRSVYFRLDGTTTAASGSGFNTIYVKRAGVWTGIV